MRFIFMAPMWAVLVAAMSAATAAAPPAIGPSVRDIVEFKRIVQPEDQNEEELREQVSPDGKLAFIVTRQSEVESDANHYDILLLDVAPDRLAAQRAPAPRVVFSVKAAHDNRIVTPAIGEIRWFGDRTLVFMARLKTNSYQVYSLDVLTRKLAQLTHEPNAIVSFAAARNLQRVVYTVQISNPPLKGAAHAVAVGHQSFWGVEFGQHNLILQDRVYQYFVSDVASSKPPRALGAAFTDQNGVWPTVSISPDGRWAVLPRWKPERQAEWDRDYPMIAELSRNYADSQRVDPLSYFSTPIGYVPRQMVAWRLDDGKEQPIIDAPDDAFPGSGQLRADRLWQGSGESLVLAGVHLPLSPGSQQSSASHAIEYWPSTGRWADIATLQDRLTKAIALPDGFILEDGTTRREFHRQAGGGWREVTGLTPTRRRVGSTWTLHIPQSLNQPPDIYAVGPAGERRRLTALSPQFKEETWGTMQPYSWRDSTGMQWNGGLMSTNAMDVRTPRPLLIQTYGFSPDRFYLDGPNESEGATSAYAGRAFLREGILVLAMPLTPPPDLTRPNRGAQEPFDRAVRGAVDALVKEGRVDPARVGIMGWSRLGQRVLNLVTFGDLPIRAATTADGDANSVFALTVTYGRAADMWESIQDSNDGLPFGHGLSAWVRNDPAMHTDCIHSALRIETYGPTVESNWDIYALLRRQYKAAEMVVIPGGGHSLMTPGDRMASLQGNVDWYGFWLADKTRSVPVSLAETSESLASQYAQWQQMATLKTADDARPGCVR